MTTAPAASRALQCMENVGGEVPPMTFGKAAQAVLKTLGILPV